jgi:hypothetical protein
MPKNPVKKQTNPEDVGISVKLQSYTKTKRLRDIPETFELLKAQVEAQIKDEREPAVTSVPG